MVGTILEAFRDSPFLCRSELNDGASHEWFGYSVPGMHKNGQANEDRLAARSKGKVTWFLVADGVSTADLGNGEMAAEEIVRLLGRVYDPQFEALAGQLMAKPVSEWLNEADRFLADFFRDANLRVVSLVNELYAERRPGSAPSLPMSSTLVSALVACDQAIIRHLGDSTAWLFRPGTGVLHKLTSEHNAGGESRFSFDTNDREAALTRVIGACRFSQADDTFVAIEQQADVLRVQLRPGDLFAAGQRWPDRRYRQAHGRGKDRDAGNRAAPAYRCRREPPPVGSATNPPGRRWVEQRQHHLGRRPREP